MALTLTLTLTLILTQIMRVLPLLLQSVTSFIYFCLTGLTTISIYFWINFWMFADDLLPMSDLKLYTFNISPLNVIFAEFFFFNFGESEKAKELLIYSLFAKNFDYDWILNFTKCFLSQRYYFICVTFLSCFRNPFWITFYQWFISSCRISLS